MRNISPQMAAALAENVTTLAQCWKLMRRDGVILGFTDHDRDIVLDGITYAALTGVQGTQTEADFGFATGGGEIAGALSAEGLADGDLAKGLWDGAAVEIYLVNWAQPSQALLLDRAVLGEIRRRGSAFTAELRGLAHRLDEERGRVYTAQCAASLGDQQCSINVASPQYSHQGAVADAANRHIIRTPRSSHDEGMFSGGRLEWMSGANAGAQHDIATHVWDNAIMIITLCTQPVFEVAAGDTFRITAGCDKSWSMCRNRFSNAANFRGFPHMPGNDLLLKIAQEGEGGMDGGSLFR